VRKNSIEIITGTSLLTPVRTYSETFFGEVHGSYNVSPEFTPDNFFIYGVYTKRLFGKKTSFLAMAANFGYQHYHIKCSETGYDSGGYLGTYFKGTRIKEWQNDYAALNLSLTHNLRVNEGICFSNSIGFADNWLLHYLYIEKSYGSTYGNQVVDKQSSVGGWHNTGDGLSQQNEFFIFYRMAGTCQIS
jgi:subtilase family serine protease